MRALLLQAPRDQLSHHSLQQAHTHPMLHLLAKVQIAQQHECYRYGRMASVPSLQGHPYAPRRMRQRPHFQTVVTHCRNRQSAEKLSLELRPAQRTGCPGRRHIELCLQRAW